MKPDILLTVPIYPPALAQLEGDFTVHKLWTAPEPARFLEELSTRVRAVVTVGAIGLPAGLIERLPRLELIACFGNPHGTLDEAEAARRGIAITNTPDTISGIVAELAVGMAIALMRRIVENDRFVREGRWPGGAPRAGKTLIGKRCGIVGLGKIGREVATRLDACGMTVSYQGPREKPGTPYRYHSDVESLARESDCLVVTCPLTDATRNLIDRSVLEALGPEGFLVNVSRGPVIDEPALIDALKNRRIAGAALDVYSDEPNVPQALRELTNVVLLPHIGSTTVEIREERARKLMANLRAHFAGEALPHPLRAPPTQSSL